MATERLYGRVAIVTGASSGIGRGVAIAFAREGAKVVLAARTQRELENVAQEIRSQNGEVSVFVGDLASERANMMMVEFAIQTYGSIDVLSVNAGMFLSTTLTEVTEEMIDIVFGVNFKAILFALKYALPVMRDTANGAGSVVLTTGSLSTAINSKMSDTILYSASKAAAKMIMQYAAIQAAGVVRVNAVAPGLTRSFFLQTKGDDEVDHLSEESGLIPRMGEVDDVVPAIVHLASDESSFTTGAEFVVDGGWSLNA